MAGTMDWKKASSGGASYEYDDDDDDTKTVDEKSKSYEVPTIKRAMAFLLFQDKFSDIAFIVGRAKTRIPAHRFVLAAHSPIFEAMLFDPFVTANDPSLHIGANTTPAVVTLADVDVDIFRQLLTCVYTNKAKLTTRTVSDALTMARKYKVEVFRVECLSFMEQSMNIDNACGLFETAPRVLGDDKFGLEFIEKNAEDVIQTHGFTSLSPSRVATIVKDSKLDCSEERLFKAVIQWGKAECRRNGMDPDERALRGVLSDIIPHIRFTTMKMSFIAAEVNTSGLLAPDQLLKLFTYVNQGEDDRDPKSVDFPTTSRTPDLPRFKYGGNLSVHDGIIHWIATQEGRSEWANPHTSGLVTVTASSHCPSLNPGNSFHHVVERTPSVSFGTNSLTDSWIQIDLKKYAVIPDHYRFSNTRLTNCQPRTWRFQGRNEGGSWVTLRSHDADHTLTDTNQNAHFQIDGCHDAYRTFRILQPGMSSEGGFGHLCCAGLEIWGRLRRL